MSWEVFLNTFLLVSINFPSHSPSSQGSIWSPPHENLLKSALTLLSFELVRLFAPAISST